MIVESMKQTDGIPSPAITFSVPKQIMEHCFDRNESTEECLEKACLKQTDVIKSVTIGSLLKIVYLDRGRYSSSELVIISILATKSCNSSL